MQFSATSRTFLKEVFVYRWQKPDTERSSSLVDVFRELVSPLYLGFLLGKPQDREKSQEESKTGVLVLEYLL